MHRKQGGITLIEAALAGAIVIVMIGALSQLISRSIGVTGQGTSLAVLDMRAGQTLERITTELMSADITSLQPATPQGSSELSFRQCTGFVGSTPQWSPLRRIAFVSASVDSPTGGTVVWGGAPGAADPIVWLTGVSEHLEDEVANGVDDNGNGLIDERGLCFSLQGRVLTVRLTVRGTAANGQALVRTLSTAVHLRI